METLKSLQSIIASSVIICLITSSGVCAAMTDPATLASLIAKPQAMFIAVNDYKKDREGTIQDIEAEDAVHRVRDVLATQFNTHTFKNNTKELTKVRSSEMDLIRTFVADADHAPLVICGGQFIDCIFKVFLTAIYEKIFVERKPLHIVFVADALRMNNYKEVRQLYEEVLAWLPVSARIVDDGVMTSINYAAEEEGYYSLTVSFYSDLTTFEQQIAEDHEQVAATSCAPQINAHSNERVNEYLLREIMSSERLTDEKVILMSFCNFMLQTISIEDPFNVVKEAENIFSECEIFSSLSQATATAFLTSLLYAADVGSVHEFDRDSVQGLFAFLRMVSEKTEFSERFQARVIVQSINLLNYYVFPCFEDMGKKLLLLERMLDFSHYAGLNQSNALSMLFRVLLKEPGTVDTSLFFVDKAFAQEMFEYIATYSTYWNQDHSIIYYNNLKGSAERLAVIIEKKYYDWNEDNEMRVCLQSA